MILDFRGDLGEWERLMGATSKRSGCNRLGKESWIWGYSLQITSSGETIFTADAHLDRKRFIVHADEKLSAFLELQAQTAQLAIAARNPKDWTNV